jgi:F0F1-type ATP synthase delta subunit
MTHDRYSQAAVALLRAGRDAGAVIEGLRLALASRGHESLLPRILESAMRELRDRFDPKLSRATVASERAVETENAAIQLALKRLGVDGAADVGIDHSLVGGFVVEYRHRRIDSSHKRALKELYRAITFDKSSR